MQEEVNHKTISFTVSTTKMTTKTLLKLARMYLAHLKNKKAHPNIIQGKQSIKDLAKQNQGMTNIEITEKNIKSFEKYARKYGVDFALKKDKTLDPPKYMVFFKARDTDAITAAFKEYTADMMKKKDRPSVIENLKKMKQKVQENVIDKVKNKHKEQSL